MVLILFVFICVVGAIIAYNWKEPKNVFEEIYAAEMHAAKYKQYTPLSNTEYFDEAIADYVDYNAKRLKSTTVKESPKDTSQYSLGVEFLNHLGEKSPLGRAPGLRQKSVDIKSRFVYHDIDIKVYYLYILSNEGDAESLKKYVRDEGLSIYITGSFEGTKLRGYKEFASYGIVEDELDDRIKQDLSNILNYWIDNYVNSKFQRDEFGLYEVIDNEIVEKHRGVFAEV